jgi:altronate dehydratase
MSVALPLSAVGRLPAPGDNVAIAIRRLEAGTAIALDAGTHVLAHTVLEGHRFTVRAVAAGEALLSWGLPFGHALAPIPPATYICNQSILDWLVLRRVELTIPAQPNFADHLVAYTLDESTVQPSPPVARRAAPRTFAGYRRAGSRGVGTRNYIVILGTTSRTASFARQLAARLQPLARVHPGIDGIVAVAHTEGGGPEEPNNTAEILRALAGFMVHPNVGAVLAVDYGLEPVTNARLEGFMRARGYPLADVPHAFLSITRGLAPALAEGEARVRGWLPAVAAQRRTDEPLAHLRVALQCGGSDAFSGVSGNPLAGAMVHELVRHGGTGVLCETDELSGAESYLMKNVRDVAIARALLERIARFRTRLAWHGVTPESNPSAGNKLRGLYNITLKSLGAVHKKDPRTRIDEVIDYAEPLGAPGFYFMDSPGNDLEGIAGQVGAGCNLLLFVTGNGSITNFPFVPTLKITTTTRRHELLLREMDINAGRYLDGESFDLLAAESFEQLLAAASGRRTKGEEAGHSQSSLWRNWRQTDASRIAEIRTRPAPDGRPIPIAIGPEVRPAALPALALARHGGRAVTERVGLVLPTSMCAAQIARLAAERMNDRGMAPRLGLDRFVALPHSEGCGFGGETMYQLLHRTYRGYATHPNVAAALLLEHGCEKIPNDVMRRQFETAGLPLDRFGWASVQLDGGIEQSLGKVAAWFTRAGGGPAPADGGTAGWEGLIVGLLSDARADGTAGAVLGAVARAVLVAGGSVLLPEGDALWAQPAFSTAILGSSAPRPTLAHGQPLEHAGLHAVQTDTDHWVENLTGLGACGVHVMVGLVHGSPQQGHPLLPVLQVAPANQAPAAEDIDCVLGPGTGAGDLLALIAATARRDYVPVATAGGFTDFQLTRGLLGVST